jgi:hypothetical protein
VDGTSMMVLSLTAKSSCLEHSRFAYRVYYSVIHGSERTAAPNRHTHLYIVIRPA